MHDIDELEQRLQGCPHANVRQLAKEHFTVEFLERMAAGYHHMVRVMKSLGGGLGHTPSELDKCVVHYCVRALIKDLWEFSAPRIKRFVKPDGQFDLETVLADGEYGALSEDLAQNLETGREIIYGITSDLYGDWVEGLRRRSKEDKADQIPLMFRVYRLHSVLIVGGDWEIPSVLENTYTSANKERFEWLEDHPDLSRQELEEVVANSIQYGIAQASQLSIKSSAKEEVSSEAARRGQRSFVFDAATKQIVFNPSLLPEVEKMEEELRPMYYDRTHMVLGCPAKFVSPQVYGKGSMLHELLRFRDSVYVEIYLATHGRR